MNTSMNTGDSFDRLYRASARFFTSPQLQLVMALFIALFALVLTLGALLQTMPALTRVAVIAMAVFCWLFAIIWFNWWRKWKVVVAWKQESIRKAESVNNYFQQVDAGELPAEPIPPEIIQNFRDVNAAWLKDLKRQEWMD